MVGHAVEPEDLVEPEAKEALDAGLLGAAGGASVNQPVEGGLPADDPAGQLAGESAIGGGQGGPGAGEGLIKQVLEPTGAAFGPLEDAGGNFSWFFDTHPAILPNALKQSSF
jgi:hypothetical protein